MATFKKCLEREVSEGLAISNSKANVIMNSKSEHHQPAVHRKTVTREVRHGSWDSSWVNPFKTDFIFVLFPNIFSTKIPRRTLPDKGEIQKTCIHTNFLLCFCFKFQIQLVCLRKMSRRSIIVKPKSKSTKPNIIKGDHKLLLKQQH